MQINKIKTMYGLKYAIVDTSFTYDKKGNKLPYTHAVEYSTDQNGKTVDHVAIFPYTNEGLVRAKEIRSMLTGK